MQTLIQITEIRVKIEDAAISVQWMPRLSKDNFNRLAHSSTAIEGNPLTLREVELLSAGKDVPQRKPRDKADVANYHRALKYITDHAQKKITEKDILKLHSIIGDGYVITQGPVGEYRDYAVSVGPHNPPKYPEVPGLVSELLDWLGHEKETLNGVVLSAIAHYQFEYIHPFGDGNGRVGRLLAIWVLFNTQFDTHHIISVDEEFQENRDTYYKALRKAETANGDITSWIEYAADAVLAALKRAFKRIQAIQVQEKSGRKIVLNEKQERLLVLLHNAPMSVPEMMQELKVTKGGVHFLIKPLLEHGIIVKKGGHKTGKYEIN